MASANFEDSQVFKVWGQQGVEFKPDLDFGKKLLYTEHPNGGLVTIYYVTDTQWSRRRKESILNEDGETISDRMIKAASELFTSGRFLWHANKAVTESPFHPPAQRLPNKPHGLNVFTDYDDIVFLSSLNPTTDHFRFLKEQYGIEGDEVRGFTYFSAAYQAIMRTSIRDPESLSAKRILVPDLSLAEYLHEILPGSKLEKLDIGLVEQPPKKPGRPRKHASNRERVAQQRQKAKEKQLQLLADQLRLRVQDTNERNWENKENGWSCAENTIELYSGLGTQPLTATLYSSMFSPIPLAYASGDINAFVDFLCICHEHQPKSKQNSYLFSPAIFDPNRSTEKSRGTENIIYLRHIVLDFEDGELKPETLPKLFPDIQMVVTNTFSHTWDRPRFRAVFFTSETMTPEVYGLIYGWIGDKLEEAGYWVDRNDRKRKSSGRFHMCASGLDWHGSRPTSVFYLPCQAKDPKESFFHEHIEGRYPLNPSRWIENSAIPLQPALEPIEQLDVETREVDRSSVESAVKLWRESQVEPGNGHDMFFMLARSLKLARMDYPEIEMTLRSEADYAYRPSERKVEIPGLIRDLREYFLGELWRPRIQAISATQHHANPTAAAAIQEGWLN
jgi:hypothetical protein